MLEYFQKRMHLGLVRGLLRLELEYSPQMRILLGLVLELPVLVQDLLWLAL